MISGIMGSAGGFLRVVPLWAWAIAALVAYGAFQRASARHVRAEFNQATAAAAAERAASAAEATIETERRKQEVRNAVNAGKVREAQLQAAVAGAVGAREQLQQQLAALEAERCARDPGPAAGSAAASAPADLRAYVHRRLEEAADGVAEFAERANSAGQTCVDAWPVRKK